MPEESKPEDERKRKLTLEDLELNKETVEELTEGEADGAKGGGGAQTPVTQAPGCAVSVDVSC